MQQNDMLMGGDTLYSRAVSSFAISIGTGLALEALFQPTAPVYDAERQAPMHVLAGSYNECWINVTTMFRNIAQAMNKTGFAATKPEEFKDAMLQEMGIIDSLFQVEGMGLCKPRYYYTNHDKLRARLPEQVKFRPNDSDIQKAYQEKLKKTIDLLDKETEVVSRFDEDLKVTGHPTGLILTHQPYDLLSYQRFSKLSLLESHTGMVKERSRWYTKYYPVGPEDMSHMPFIRKLLYIFGDRVLLQPGIMKLRQQLLQIGRDRKWHALTTESKVMMDIELEVQEPYVIAFIRSL